MLRELIGDGLRLPRIKEGFNYSRLKNIGIGNTYNNSAYEWNILKVSMVFLFIWLPDGENYIDIGYVPICIYLHNFKDSRTFI